MTENKNYGCHSQVLKLLWGNLFCNHSDSLTGVELMDFIRCH